MSLNLKQRIEEGKNLISFNPRKIKKLGLVGKISLGLAILGFSSGFNCCAIDETAQRNNNGNAQQQNQEESESGANPLLGLIAAGILDYTDLDPALKDVLKKGSGVVYNQQSQEERNKAIRNSGRNKDDNQGDYSNTTYSADLIKKMDALKGTDYWLTFDGTIFKKAPESFVCLDGQDINKNGMVLDYYDLIGLKSIFTIDEIEKNSNCLYFGFNVDQRRVKKLLIKIKDSEGRIKYLEENNNMPYENGLRQCSGALNLLELSIINPEKARDGSNQIEEFSIEWYTNGELERKDVFFIDYSSKK